MRPIPDGAAAIRRAREDRIVEIARAQHGVVTRAQLLAIGLRPGAIRQRLEDRRLIGIHRGVYGVGPLLAPRASMMAAVLACGPRAVLGHRSAAALFGIVPASADGDPIDVSVPLPFGRTRRGVRVRRVRHLDPDETTLHDGIPVTAPTRTLVDLATVLDDYELERAIGRAEREGLVTGNELAPLATRYHWHPAAGRVRAIVERAGGPSFTRSGAESRFLALVRRARLPPPRVNVELAGYEIDFLWSDLHVAVEVDGYRFHASRPSFEADRRRTARLAAMGIQVVPFTWRQIVEDELATAVQLGQVLARAQRR